MSLREQLSESEEASLLAASLDHGLGAIEDPGTRVRLLFPLPLALSWREMELEERSMQRYDAALRTFEASVGYIVAMLIADLREKACEVEGVGRLIDGFETPGRGPTLGDRIQVLRQAPSVSPEEALETSPFPELRVLLSEDRERSDWWQAVNALLEARNDLAHGRGPRSDAQFGRKLVEVESGLQTIFDRLGFLTRFRLSVVNEFRFDELSGTREARVKELMGDHPIVPEQIITVTRELGPGLYIKNAASDLTLCSPWMEYSECPECGNWEVTTPEFASQEDPGRTCQKSLRSGHMHPGRSGSLLRIAKFAGIQLAE